MLNKFDVHVEPELVVIPNEPIVDQPIEPITKVPLRRSQDVRRLQYQMIMFICMRVALTYANLMILILTFIYIDYWLTTMREEFNSMHDNDVMRLVDIQIILN